IGKGGGRLHIRLLIIGQGKIHLVVHSLVAPRLFSRAYFPELVLYDAAPTHWSFGSATMALLSW
ncbi:MAG: hypothetical protein ACRC91_08285, partial [Aeromonas sp.]